MISHIVKPMNTNRKRFQLHHNRSTNSDEDVPVKKLNKSFASDSSSTSGSETDDSENTSFRLHQNQNELSNVEYLGKGLKQNLHGADFQLKLLMLILCRAHFLKLPEFGLATELPESEKFDDVVFLRRNHPTEKWQIRLYQVKHREAERNQLIRQSDLISSNDTNPWQLSKYMCSFEKIQKLCHSDSLYSPFSGARLEELVIITNAEIQPDLLEQLDECVGIEAVDEFIEFSNAQTKKYKINPSVNRAFVRKLTQSFVESSDFRKLVKMLAHSAVEKTKIEKTLLIREYVIPLHDVLECNETDNSIPFAKFTKKFLCKSNSSEFRKALIHEVGVLRGSKAKGALAFLKNVNIPISAGLAQALNVQPGLDISNCQEFARQFYNIFMTREYNQRNFSINSNTITSTPEELEIFKDNVFALGVEHVLVERLSKIRFSTSFIKGRIDNKSISNFREELISLIGTNFESTIVQYSFDIDIENFRAELEENLERKLPEPYSKTDCELFFSKLRLVVNYPNRIEITSRLEAELKTAYQNLNCNAVGALLTVNLQNWMTSRTGTFYTAEKVDTLFRQMDANVLCWSWHGMNESYLAECPKFEFKNQKLHELIRVFLANCEGSVMNLMFDDLLFGRIRVVQSLFTLQNDDSDETLQQFSRVFGYVFLKLKQFRSRRFLKKFQKICRDEHQWNLIVVECDTSRRGPIKRLKAFIDRHGTSRKVILVTQLNDPIPMIVPEAYQQTVLTRFDDLTEASWKKIGTKRVIFQGIELALNDLIDTDSRHLIDASTLCKLLKDEPIQIGGDLKYSSGYDPVVYIERCFSTMDIRDEVKPCKNPNTVILSDTAGNLFGSCGDSTELRLPSRSLIENSHQDRVENSANCCSEAELITLSDDCPKVLIISDTAGMGKTTTVSNLSKQLKSKFDKLWVIRINLNDHTTYLNAELQAREENRSPIHTRHRNSAFNFLKGLIFTPNRYSSFETKLFENALVQANRLKVAVLFDGFDEISPTYAGIMLDLVQGLQRMQLQKMIITTRPTMAERLEQELNGFVHHLHPLTQSEKQTFLRKFWTKRLKPTSGHCENRLNTYVEHIMPMSDIHVLYNKLTSNPLQLCFLAELFAKPESGSQWQSCEEFMAASNAVPRLPTNLKSYDVYTRFITKKIRIYFEEKMRQDPSNVAFQSELNDRLQQLIKDHQLLAVFALCENKCALRGLLVSAGTYEEQIERIRCKIERIENGEDKCGLINGIVDGQPQFLHRSIAEYFLVCYVGEVLTHKLQHPDFLEAVVMDALRFEWFWPFWETWLANARNRSRITDETKYQLGAFLKSIWGPETCTSFLCMTCGPSRFVYTLEFFTECFRNDVDFVREIVNQQAEFGEYLNALSTACKDGHLDILKILVSKCQANVNDDQFVREVVLQDSPQIWNWIVCDTDTDVQTLLHSAIRFGGMTFCKWLHSKRTYTNEELTVPGCKPIHLAAMYGRIDFIEWLVSVGADIHDRDRYGRSILHFAAFNNQLDLIGCLVRPTESGGYGMDIHVKDDLNQSLLHAACFAYDSHAVEALIVYGFDINWRDSFGSSPLHLCAMHLNTEGIKVLLSNGVDVNAVRNDGKTALHLAAEFRKIEGVYHGANRYVHFVKAVRDLDPESRVNALYKEYSNCFSDDPRGMEEIELAFKVPVIRMLMENGADPMCRDNSGWTVLHSTAVTGSRDLCRWFLESKEDLGVGLKACHMIDYYGNSVLRSARCSGNDGLCRWLEDNHFVEE